MSIKTAVNADLAAVLKLENEASVLERSQLQSGTAAALGLVLPGAATDGVGVTLFFPKTGYLF